jgi:hypothetical protein
MRSRDSGVGIARGYGLDGRGSILGKGTVFLISIASRPALGPTQLPGPIFLAVNRPEREADHSPPSKAEIKNGGAIPPFLFMSP